MKHKIIRQLLATIFFSYYIPSQASQNIAPLLHRTAQKGHMEALEWLLDNDSLIEQGKRLLEIAAGSGQIPFIQHLLARGVTPHGSLALHKAAMCTQLRAIDVLLRAGIDIDAQDLNGQTALHWATELGDNGATVEKLISAGANVNARDNMKTTPLHLAARLDWHNITNISLLLEASAEVNAEDHREATPLSYAHEYESTLLLLQAGANGKTKSYWPGNSALAQCVQKKDFQRALTLLQHGLSPDFSRCGQFSILEAILTLVYNDSTEDLKEAGITFAKTVIVAGASLNWTDDPLALHASLIGDLGLLQTLIEHGVNVNERNHLDHSPLGWAIDSDNLPMLCLLLQAGAHDEPYEFQETVNRATHYCSKNPELGRELLRRGYPIPLQGPRHRTDFINQNSYLVHEWAGNVHDILLQYKMNTSQELPVDIIRLICKFATDGICLADKKPKQLPEEIAELICSFATCSGQSIAQR